MQQQANIEAFFFDIGGVLVKVDSSAAITSLSGKLKVSEEVIREAISQDVLEKYEKGHLNSNQFYENLLINCSGKELMDLDHFKTYWQDVLFPNKPMIDFLQRATRTYPAWLLSNTNDFHYELLLEQFPFMQWVQGGTFSFMEASMKPEPRIYQLAIAKSNLSPSRILFIDDLEVNVFAARQQGLNAIHFRGYDAFAEEILRDYPDLGNLL